MNVGFIAGLFLKLSGQTAGGAVVKEVAPGLAKRFILLVSLIRDPAGPLARFHDKMYKLPLRLYALGNTNELSCLI